MSQKPLLAYVHSLVDAPGVPGAPYTYMSVFNPPDTGRATVALASDFQVYATGTSLVAQSLKIYRISAHSGGTLVSPSVVQRFDTAHPDPISTVRVGNPAITTTGHPLRGIAPVIGTGTGGQSALTTQSPSGFTFVCYPGEGLAFRTDSSSANIRWNIVYIWAEFG